jgi:predicted XRE-type DNA-binding protein
MSAELDNDTEEKIVDGSGNVFADLGLPHNEEEMLKIQIALAITNTLRKRKLTQADAARIVGTDQAKISNILRGRVKGFSAERLMRFLIFLGRDVDIHVSRRLSTSGPGKLRLFA